MIKPKKLERGDTIAFIAPAGGMAANVPHRLEKAKKFFQEKGFKVKIYPTAEKNIGFSSDTPENRAEDINNAFKDSEVKAIISTIGGKSTHQTLEYLDFDSIKNNPKILCGYSDITTLHFALNKKCNLTTFYGPSAISEFGETLNLEEYTVNHFFKALTREKPIGKIEASKRWTDCKKADWFKREDLEIKREYEENKGWEWLRKGKVEGELSGGCISSFCHTAGTEYRPDFKGKILVLETPEGERFYEGESILNINSYLADLRLQGVFEDVKGIVFGRGFGYSEEQIKKLKESIDFNTRGYDFPIVYGLDIGHTDPMVTLPLGVKAKLDSDENEFEILESGVE